MQPVRRSELIRTRDQMIARGPDGFGAWFSDDGRIGLGHRRLSIIDLSEAGAQPMLSADRRLAVTFNGEIFNYQDLRRRLRDKGRIFKSHSDTEVLLHLYAEKGADMCAICAACLRLRSGIIFAAHYFWRAILTALSHSTLPMTV